MGNLLEISEINQCRVFFEKNQGSRERFFFSAYVQLPNQDQLILDDRILPRLKKRLSQILSFTVYPESHAPSAPAFPA